MPEPLSEICKRFWVLALGSLAPWYCIHTQSKDVNHSVWKSLETQQPEVIATQAQSPVRKSLWNNTLFNRQWVSLCWYKKFKMMKFPVFWEAKIFYYKTCTIILSSPPYKNRRKSVVWKGNISKYCKRHFCSEIYILETTRRHGGEW